MQPVRYTVSSTELLYERAMAKFYQAVANENAIEIDKIERFSTKKLSRIGVDNLERRKSVPYGNIEQIIAQTVIKPLKEGKQVAVKRRLSTETSETLLGKCKNGKEPSYAFDLDDLVKNRNHFQKPVKNLDLSLSSPIDKTSSLDRSPNKKIKIVEDLQIVNKEETYSSDYTDSTVSSSDSIVTKMASLKERLSNIESDGDEESKTYHPRSINLRSLTSPYKLPEHGQAVNVLTKPHPLPDPNFVPKPILKRPTSPIPTSENVNFLSSPTRPPSIPKIRAFSPPPQSTTGSLLMIPPSPEQIGAKQTLEEREHTSRKGIKIFKKITTSPLSSKEKLNVTNMKQKQKFIKGTQLSPALLKHDQFVNPLSTDISEPSVTMIQTLDRPQIKASNERGRKLLRQRQNSEEENKTVIDHYTTILRDHDTVQTAKDKIPIYLNRDAIKKEHEKAKEEGDYIDLEEEQNKPIVSQDKKRELDLNALTFIRRQRSKDSSVNQSLQSRDQSLARNQIKGQFSATIVLKSNSLPKNRIDAFHSDRRSTHSRDTLPSKQLVMSLPTKYLPLNDITVSRFNNTDDVFKDNKKLFQYSRSDNESQISTRSKTPEELDVENRLKSNMSYVMDVCLLGFSFYLYIFKDAVFCIPILILLIYRHLGEVIKKKSVA